MVAPARTAAVGQAEPPERETLADRTATLAPTEVSRRRVVSDPVEPQAVERAAREAAALGRRGRVEASGPVQASAATGVSAAMAGDRGRRAVRGAATLRPAAMRAEAPALAEAPSLVAMPRPGAALATTRAARRA